ncbi:MAG: phage major capsid protein [Microcella sp.]|uniref:phage major capsid protein n=1 Tax=Microcella sp. TaxID=1913979 RepID=UPI00271B78BF|nr:phage major capsid protein [Microcella sp.]MDO8338434.1 phage major capsid protein [Microcella sp.]
MRTISDLVTQKRDELNTHTLRYNSAATELGELRKQPAVDAARVAQLSTEQDAANLDVQRAQRELEYLQRELADEERLERAAQVSVPAARGISPTASVADRASADLRAGEYINVQTRERAAVRADESVRQHPAFARSSRAGDADTVSRFGDLGQMLRAMTTTSGSAIIPTDWAANIIDRVRNEAAVAQAGATFVPMAEKTVKIGRLTGDPTAAFRAEGSTVVASDVTLDNVTLDAKTQSALVIGSLEWFQDADNAEEIVYDAIAKQMALNVDLVALYGSITTGAGTINLPTPPNPRGILGALNANRPGNVLGAATNGTAQTATSFYNELIDLIYKVREGNEEPTAVISNSRLAQRYARAYDTTGQPLAAPAEYTAIRRLISNQIQSYTQGTMANIATDVFAGDFSKLLIGQRLDITIQTLTERYADTGQIGIIAHWRGDVQLARESAFAVYRALQGA